jgi:hypothetical protein
MIRLKMGREPAALRTQRKANLPLAIAAFNAHGAGSPELAQTLRTGYQVAKETLRSRQHGKCAFCEMEQDACNQPVEHFRPKGAADDFDGKDWNIRVSSHYWWLTWTWSNLFFSCSACNRSGRKGNRFPIEAGHTRIAAPTLPLTRLTKAHNAVKGERALLVNPRTNDPFLHLQWMPVDRRLPRARWEWAVEGRDPSGDMTIRTLELDFRTDDVNRHLRRTLSGRQAIDAAIASNRLTDARAAWRTLLDVVLVDKTQPFRLAVWWALDSLYPAAERRRLGLTGFSKPQG